MNFMIPELQISFGKYQTDEHAWIETIKSIKNGGTVKISTMDWLGQSEYDRQLSFLSTTISEVIFAKYAKVKILVAYWAHYMSNTDQYLKSLLYSNNLCSSSPDNNCSGKIEIKSNTIWFFVSGNVSMTTWSNCLSMSKWVIWDFQLCSSTVDCKYVYDESRRKILDNEYIKHFAPESSLKIPTGQIFCF